MTLDARALYQAVILDHGKQPRNVGPLAGATHEATRTNPLCGDRVTLRLRVEDGVVREARFEARGCMIAQASASLLTAVVAGMTTAVVRALGVEVAVLAREDGPVSDDRLEPLRGARHFPARRACVTLAWDAAIDALRDDRDATR